MFQLSSLEAESVHLTVSSKLTIGSSEKDGRLVFCDYRSKGGVPQGMQLFTNGVSLGPQSGEEHTIVPMPLMTVVGTLLGG